MNNEIKTKIQDEVINRLPLKPHGLLNYSVRFGKSRIVCELVRKNNPKKILWVTLSAELRDKDIPDEIKSWLGEEYFDRFKIICYKSLSKEKGDYDLIVLDEYQAITEESIRPLLNGTLKYEYIIGVTGTPPKSLDKIRLLWQLRLLEIDKFDIDLGVEKGIIAPYRITTIPVKLNSIDQTVKAGSKEKPFYTTETKSYDYYTSQIDEKKKLGQDISFLSLNRARMIYNSRSKSIRTRELLKSLKGRTLIFAGSIDQSKEITQNIFNSKTGKDNFNKFQNGEINTLCCVNKGGVGFTYKGVDNFIIVQCNSNNTGDITQKIGRALLAQKDYTANIYILYLQDTVDETWKDRVLRDFNSEYITELPKIK